MLKHLTNTWTLFYALVFGLFLLMISERPELQARPGREQAPAPAINIAGQALTWTTGTVLAVRMVRETRVLLRNNRSDPGA